MDDELILPLDEEEAILPPDDDVALLDEPFEQQITEIAATNVDKDEETVVALISKAYEGVDPADYPDVPEPEGEA